MPRTRSILAPEPRHELWRTPNRRSLIHVHVPSPHQDPTVVLSTRGHILKMPGGKSWTTSKVKKMNDKGSEEEKGITFNNLSVTLYHLEEVNKLTKLSMPFKGPSAMPFQVHTLLPYQSDPVNVFFRIRKKATARLEPNHYGSLKRPRGPQCIGAFPEYPCSIVVYHSPETMFFSQSGNLPQLDQSLCPRNHKCPNPVVPSEPPHSDWLIMRPQWQCRFHQQEQCNRPDPIIWPQLNVPNAVVAFLNIPHSDCPIT